MRALVQEERVVFESSHVTVDEDVEARTSDNNLKSERHAGANWERAKFLGANRVIFFECQSHRHTHKYTN